MMLLNDDYFMRQALKEAHEALIKRRSGGCRIVANQRIIARAHNLTEALNDVTAHAEMQPLRGGQRDGREVLERLHAVCHRGTMPHVRGALRWAQVAGGVWSGDEKRGSRRYRRTCCIPRRPCTRSDGCRLWGPDDFVLFTVSFIKISCIFKRFSSKTVNRT